MKTILIKIYYYFYLFNIKNIKIKNNVLYL